MKRIIGLAVLLVACAERGPEGDQGPAGPPGPRGPAGPQPVVETHREITHGQVAPGTYDEVYAYCEDSAVILGGCVTPSAKTGPIVDEDDVPIGWYCGVDNWSENDGHYVGVWVMCWGPGGV